jgi:FixJ family two-component response regulator
MLADVVIPRMRGHEVAARIQGAHPRMKLLYMSGYSLEVLGLQNAPPPGLEFIAKPFSVEAILRRVRGVLDTWPARAE